MSPKRLATPSTLAIGLGRESQTAERRRYRPIATAVKFAPWVL
jgi:hypothetical protein